nr:lysophosphatidic acid phosphatase type 6 [Hymenolepis microstoma]
MRISSRWYLPGWSFDHLLVALCTQRVLMSGPSPNVLPSLQYMETTKDIPEILIAVKYIDIIDGTPIEENSEKFHGNKILPGGETVGVLTTQGQKDLYDLGVQMRKAYAGPGGILSDPPKITEIETRSTRVQRNLKSMRSLIAGLTNGHIDGTLEIPSTNYDEEILYPNLKLNNDIGAFYEGVEELQQNVGLKELKEKIKKALMVDSLVDEFDSDPEKHLKDCQVYYVRDDFAARKHHGFPIPKRLAELEGDIDYYSAVEILSEILGKQELDINIGPVLHIILSKMLNYTNNPPLQLYAVHDSSILPILLALDSWDETWPPFAADITFELHLQTSGPSYKPSSLNKIVEFEPNSQFDWSSISFERLWVRVLYLGQPLPLTSTWMKGEVDLVEMVGSDDFIPLAEFVRRLAPFTLSMEDFQVKCQENVSKLAMDHRKPRSPMAI